MRTSNVTATLIGGIGLVILLVDTLLANGSTASLAMGLLLFAIVLALANSESNRSNKAG